MKAFKHSVASVDKVLKDITDQGASKFGDSLMKLDDHEEKEAIVLLESGTLPEVVATNLRALLDAGKLKYEIEDPDVLKKIDEFHTGLINKAIEEGRLPKIGSEEFVAIQKQKNVLMGNKKFISDGMKKK